MSLLRHIGPVGLAVIWSGVATYGFLALAARGLGVDGYAGFAVAWSLALVVGAGVFVPVEQEAARAVTEQRARGGSTRPVVRRLAWPTLWLAVLCTLVTLAAAPLLVPLLDGSRALLLVLACTPFGFAVPFLLRGVLSAEQRFGAYAAVVAVEAFLRVAGAAVLLVAGVSTAEAYVAVVALSAAASVAGGALVRPRHDRLREVPPPAAAAPSVEAMPTPVETSARGRWRDLAALVSAAVVAQVVLNSAPVLVAVLARPEERASAGRLLAGLVLVRVPLFLFTAVQAALVPRLTESAARHDVDGLSRTVRRLMVLVIGLTLVSAVICLLVGETVLTLVFGVDFRLPGHLLALLAVGVGGYLVGATASSALLALGHHGRVARGWLVGLAALALVTAAVPDLLLRTTAGFSAACVASGLALTQDLRSLVRTQRPARDTVSRHR